MPDLSLSIDVIIAVLCAMERGWHKIASTWILWWLLHDSQTPSDLENYAQVGQ